MHATCKVTDGLPLMLPEDDLTDPRYVPQNPETNQTVATGDTIAFNKQQLEAYPITSMAHKFLLLAPSFR